MAAVLAFAGLGWRRLWRDPMALVFTFLAPIAVASVMVGIYTSQDPSDGYPVGVVVVDDGGAVGAELLRNLEANPVLEVERFDSREAAERAVRRRDVAAAVVVPARVDVGSDAPVPVELVGPPEVAAPSGVRAAVEAAVTETAAALQLGRALQPDATPAGSLVAGRVALDQVGGAASTPSDDPDWWGATELALVGTLVLFVGMNTMAAGSSLPELRELGILARARTTGASVAATSLGFVLYLTSYALVVGGLVLLTGRVVFGISWASWPSLLLVVVALSLAAGGLGLLAGGLLPSPESGTTVAGPAGFMLGMLGGCLWPLEIVGPALSRLGHVTPHAWAVEALRITGIGGGQVDDVVVQLAVLCGFAAALLLVGGWRLARISERA